MRIYYDFEFVENGTTIDPLSIGLVRQDGESLYRIMQDTNTMDRAVRNPWLRNNVVAHLPVRMFDEKATGMSQRWGWDGEHPDFRHVWRRGQFARDIKEFIAATPDPQLWADYPAYDHVAYAQLFGRMIDLPDGFPMDTFNVHQEQVRMGISDEQLRRAIPPVGALHNAMADAIDAKNRHEWLIETERQHYRNTMAFPYTWS